MKTGLYLVWSLLALAIQLQGQVMTVNRLVPLRAVAGERAGEKGELAVGCGRVAVGLPGAVNPKTGVACGGVALFDTKSGKELPTIFPPTVDANAGMGFGYSVSISGNVLAIGAPGADTTAAGSENRGALYLFDLKTGKFIGTKIQDGGFFIPGERMAQVVAVDGDLVAAASVTASGFAENSVVNAGGVYVKNFRTNAFTFVSPDSAKLNGATTGVVGDDFGAAIALRGNLLVVGSPGAAVGGQADAGRVTVVSLNFLGEISDLVDEIENPAPAANDRFGQVLALGSRHLVMGAPGDAGGFGAFYLGEARTPLNMTGASQLTGSALMNGVAKALATEGSRVYFPYLNSGTRFVSGQVFNAPFTPALDFLTSEPDPSEHGAALAVADGLLAVGAPGWNGDSGSVVLYETRQIESPDMRVIHYSGNIAPENPISGTTLMDFSEVVVQLQAPATYPAGNAFFISKLAGAGAKVNPLALYAHNSAVSQTEQMGVAEATFPVISRPIGNGAGRWWWRVSYKASKLPDFFSSDGNGFFSELHNGSGSLWGVNLPLKVADELRVDNLVDNAGIVSLRLKTGGAVNASNDSGIFTMANAIVQNHGFLLREGTDLGGGMLVGEIAPRVSLRGGNIGFMCGLSGTGVTPADNQLVCFKSTSTSVRRGATAPGVLNAAGAGITATFGSFTAEVHNDDHKSLFHATLNPIPGVTTAVNEGLWSNRTGGVELVLQKGQQAPGLAAGVKVKRFLNYAIMGGDDVLILAQVGGPGVSAGNDLVLYLSKYDTNEPGYFEILAREGNRLPGTKGAKIASILRLEVAATAVGAGFNRYGLLCSLVTEAGRVTPADNLVWVIGNALPGTSAQSAVRQPLPKLRKGESSQSYGPGYERLSSIAFPAVTRDATGALLTGMASVIDPRHGGSSGVVTFPNKRKGVALIW
jgi:hypothetical protein